MTMEMTKYQLRPEWIMPTDIRLFTIRYSIQHGNTKKQPSYRWQQEVLGTPFRSQTLPHLIIGVGAQVVALALRPVLAFKSVIIRAMVVRVAILVLRVAVGVEALSIGVLTVVVRVRQVSIPPQLILVFCNLDRANPEGMLIQNPTAVDSTLTKHRPTPSMQSGRQRVMLPSLSPSPLFAS